MSRPWFPFTPTRRDAWAVILILLGLAGMIRHFSTAPEATSAPAARATASPFIATISPRSSSAGGSSRPADSVNIMRRRLRDFVIPLPNIKSLPAPDALAVLQHFWQTLPHETAAIPPAAFTLSDAAAAQLSASNSAVLVTLEIPGISLHTQFQLLAAQAGLQLRITEDGATFDLPAGPAYTENQSSTIPLDLKAWSRFAKRSERIFSGSDGSRDSSWFPFEAGWNPRSADNIQSVFPVTPSTSIEVEAVLSDDGYTIDLNIAPEVIDFYELRTYGSAIQTTGINALGQSEPVILTDSKITQPVFTTRKIPRREVALDKLLHSMAIPPQPSEPDPPTHPFAGKSFEWNIEQGTLTTTGSPQTRRIAAEATAAIHESATAGASLEFAMVEWQDNQPPVEPAAPAPKARGTGRASDKTSRPPAPPPPSRTTFKTKCGEYTNGPIPPPWTGLEFLLPAPAATASVFVEPTGSCFLLNLTLTFPGRPDIFFNNAAKSVDETLVIPRQTVKPGHWHPIHLTIKSGELPVPRQTLFVRINRAVMPLD